MSENILNAQSRTASGKGGARQLRIGGMVPGVYYGRHDDNIHFSVGEVELGRLLRTHPKIVDLIVDDDEPKQCIIRSIQRDPIHSQPLHIDLLAIHKGELITMTIPITHIGSAIGVKEGGVMEHGLVELAIECFPRNIPENIKVDVSALKIGDSIHVRDLEIPDVKILDDAQSVIAHVVLPKAEKALATEEGAGGEEEDTETPTE